jgi:hypothetical protein
LDGVQAFGSAGNVSASVTVSISGVSSSGTVGNSEGGQLLAGVQALGAVGSVTGVTYTVALTGVSASGQVGSFGVTYWSLIDDSQDANWTLIDDAQTPGWVLINTG